MNDPNHPIRLDARFGDAWQLEKWRDLTVLVAVSGGADSVALLRLLHQSQKSGTGQLIVAHFNHRWRGAESCGDAEFVQELAESLRLDFESGESHPVGGNAESKASAQSDLRELRPESEVAARKQRYDFFESAAQRRGARYVVTAHTYDDQVETVLHRILRGTGIHGLAGIPRIRRVNESLTVVRPLLTFTRAEIESYLREIQQDYRIDRTNLDTAFTRNRIRHELLPLLREQYNPNVDRALAQMAQLASELTEIMGAEVDRTFDDLVTCEGSGLRFSRVVAGGLSGPLIRETLRFAWRQRNWPLQSMGAREWALLESMVQSGQPPHANLPGNVIVTADSKFVHVQRHC